MTKCLLSNDNNMVFWFMAPQLVNNVPKLSSGSNWS